MERMFLHSWYHVQRRREADVLLIAHAQVWPWAFTFLCDMYMSGFFACASFRGHKQRSIWIFHPPSPHNGTPFLSVPTTDVSLHITSLLPPYSWSFCFHGIKKWRHQRLMYSLCIPPLLRKSHKMSMFGSVNVWETALYFRLWWNLEHSEVGVLWWSQHRGCGGCLRAGWPVLFVDDVVEVVLAFVWERQTQSKQASYMCRHNQRAVGGQGEITR